MFKHVLVVCIGNICRSPIGEALLATHLAKIAPETSVTSAGIAAMVGQGADPISIELMQEKGIDITSHRARQLTNEILLASDLILVMETIHQTHIEKMCPSVCGRVHRIGKWAGFDIPDPYKRPRVIFEQTSALIEQGLLEWQRKLFPAMNDKP